MQDNPGEELAVLVETEVSKENVSRLAESRKYTVNEKTVSGDEYVLTLTPPQK